MACYGYVRVSTERQASEGESLAVQERTIGGYATMHGLRLSRVFIEAGVSASVPLASRPAGSELLAGLSPGDAIVAPKLDRMFRSAIDALANLELLKGKGVSLHLLDLGGDVTGNGIAKLVFTILSAVAEAERDRIRERIATVKADQRSRGRYLGGRVPFAHRLTSEGDVVPDQAILGTIARLHRQGLTHREIAAKVDGGPSHTTIGRILKGLLDEAATASL